MTTVELKQDSTSNIARRYPYLVRLPPTRVAFLLASLPLICTEVISRLSLGEGFERTLLYAVASEIALIIAIEIDMIVLRRKSRLGNFRRLSTVSIISNLLWLTLTLVGLILDLVTKSEGRMLSLVILGAFFAVCFRALIFGSVFYDDSLGGLPLALIEPAILIIPVALSLRATSFYFTNVAVAVAGGLVAIAAIEIYLKLINRSVQGFRSLGLLRAFLSAWTAGNPTELEHYFQISSEERTVSTEFLGLKSTGSKGSPEAMIVVPGVHPGPFSPVGSSNLPGDIYQKMRSDSTIPLVVHSISDHDLNLPSKEEVRKYASSLENQDLVDSGKTMSAPVVRKEGRATASGFALGKTVVITLTLAPYGMEDLPEVVRRRAEEISAKSGFEACLVIDSHNSLGEKPDEAETESLIQVSSQIIDQLSHSEKSPFNFGFAHSSEINGWKEFADVGPAGVGLLLFQEKTFRFCLAIVDANNSKVGFREKVMEQFHVDTSEDLLEICTSDTHVTAAKADNAKGYLALGDVTAPDQFTSLLEMLLEKARQRLSAGAFQTSKTSSVVRTIGGQAWNNFSGLLDETTLVAKRGAQVLTVLAILLTAAVALV